MDQSVSKVAAAGILLMTPGPTIGSGGSPPVEGVSRGDTSTPSKFLLMRHPDRWDLPKGHAEAGESLRETALRETVEETGIPVTQITLDPDFQWALSYFVTYRRSGDRQFEKTVTYFLGYLPRVAEIACTEHAGYQWFDWNPPHQIQVQTIDPLLAAVQQHFDSRRKTA